MLVTGGGGQLATAIAAAVPDARVVGRPAFDFDRPETLDALFEGGDRPDALINAAAYTAVDRAESEPGAAARANADGPARLAALCARHGTPFVHVSTDYVFDGLLGRPYREDDAPNPQGVYGRTKRAGEIAVIRANPSAVIVRTSWVYGATGSNFVRTMLNAAVRGMPLKVVADQRGCPTAADDLARIIVAIAGQLGSGVGVPRGIVHVAGAGETTWHGFAEAIFQAAETFGGPVAPVTAIRTVDWPTAARRPQDSRLDCTRLHAAYGLSPLPWRQPLVAIVEQILSDRDAARLSRA